MTNTTERFKVALADSDDLLDDEECHVVDYSIYGLVLFV